MNKVTFRTSLYCKLIESQSRKKSREPISVRFPMHWHVPRDTRIPVRLSSPACPWNPDFSEAELPNTVQSSWLRTLSDSVTGRVSFRRNIHVPLAPLVKGAPPASTIPTVQHQAAWIAACPCTWEMSKIANDEQQNLSLDWLMQMRNVNICKRIKH